MKIQETFIWNEIQVNWNLLEFFKFLLRRINRKCSIVQFINVKCLIKVVLFILGCFSTFQEVTGKKNMFLIEHYVYGAKWKKNNIQKSIRSSYSKNQFKISICFSVLRFFFVEFVIVFYFILTDVLIVRNVNEMHFL